MSDEKQRVFAKYLLYADKDMCREVAEFYHEALGLSYITCAPDFYWVEFDTGPCSLCLHHNHQDQGTPTGIQTQNVVVIRPKNADAVREMHKSLLAKDVACAAEFDPSKIGEMGTLLETEEQSLCAFRIVDPVGNIVQVEADL